MRFSRLYEQTAEFRSRCKAFDFAVVAHAVLDIAIATKAKLLAMKKATLERFFGKKVKATGKKVKATGKKPHQLVLEFDGIAQLPLFRATT